MSCAPTTPPSGVPSEPWTRPTDLDQFFDGSWPRVIAHRGFSGRAPENTLAAVERAIDARADMVEIDVSLSRDGEVVVIHDETLERTTDGAGAVLDHDLADLRRLDAGSWFDPSFAGEKIPTLDEVLDRVRGRILLNVEIKTEAVADVPAEATAETLAGTIAGRVAERVRAHQLVGQVIVSSFDPRALDQLRRVAPEIRRASLYHRDLHRGLTPRQVTDPVGAHAFSVKDSLLTDAMLADARSGGDRSAGLPVAVYTVNSQRQMRRLIERGVGALFTDRPDRMVELLGRDISDIDDTR